MMGRRGMAVAALGVFSLIAPAMAQSAPGSAAPPAPADAPAATPTAEEAARAKREQMEKEAAEAAAARDSAVEEAAREIPKWEPYGASNPETLEETFFRLAQDFVSTSSLSYRRLGQVPVWPRGDLKFGRIRILPYVRVGAEWDSNIYRKNKTGLRFPNPDRPGRQSGWSQTDDVGVLADTLLNGGRTRISASIESRWQFRFRDEQPNGWELDSQAGLSHRFSRDVWGSLSYAYEEREDPTDIDFANRFERTTQRAIARVGVDRDVLFGTKMTYQFSASWRDFDTDEDTFKDINRHELEYAARVSYPFWRRVRIYGQARYRDDSRESDRINDGNVWGFDVGIDGTIPLRSGEFRGLRGNLSLGFDHAAYQDGNFAAGNQVYRRDENSRNTSLRVNAALQYLMNPRTTLDLRYTRANQFSFHGNYQINDRIDFSVTHSFSRRVTGRFQAFFEHSDPSGQLSPDYANGAPPPTRAHFGPVNRAGLGVGVRYPIEDWVDLDVSVDWEQRLAEHDSSYSNLRGLMGVTFYFAGFNRPPQLGGKAPNPTSPSSSTSAPKQQP